MADTLRGEILTHLCRQRDYLFIIVGLLGVFLVLTLVGFTIIAPGTATYALNAMNAVALSLFFVCFAAVLLHCYRSGRAYK